MNFLNKAQVIGNLTRDPELKTTKSGQSVVTVGVATNRRWKDSTGNFHEDVEFHNIVCWGRLAEIVAQYLKKGSKAYFEGRLQTRTWEDDSGNKHFRTEIVSTEMIILGMPRRKDTGEAQEVPQIDEAVKEIPADLMGTEMP
jgi:single-strand DNA-binding protein